MKITTKQMGEFLQRPSQSLGVLIYGPDDGLVLRHARSIIARILGESFDPMNLIEIEDGTLKDDPAKLADECGAMSLMGGARLVWLRGISEKYASLIEPCLPLLGEECYLLVTSGECGPRHKLRQLFEQQKQLASLACYRAEGRNLSNLIREIMDGYGQKLEPAAMQFLTQELGNNAMVTESELAKLSLYAHGKSTITVEDAKAAIIHNNDHQIDPLCNYFIDGRIRDFDALWQHLMRDNVQPIVLVRSLARYTNRLLSLKLAMQNEGYSASEAVSQARPPIFWSQKDGMTRQLNQLSTRHLIYHLHILNQAEAAFKTNNHAGNIACERILLQHVGRAKAA